MALVYHGFPLWRLTYKTLTVFLAGLLSKRYTNPSSDIITVLAGLDQVDAVFTEFAASVEIIIRTGRSCKKYSPTAFWKGIAADLEQ